MSYFIANYKGDIIAHDIQNKAKAKSILSDYLTNNPGEINNQWEVMEDWENMKQFNVWVIVEEIDDNDENGNDIFTEKAAQFKKEESALELAKDIIKSNDNGRDLEGYSEEDWKHDKIYQNWINQNNK